MGYEPKGQGPLGYEKSKVFDFSKKSLILTSPHAASKAFLAHPNHPKHTPEDQKKQEYKKTHKTVLNTYHSHFRTHFRSFGDVLEESSIFDFLKKNDRF